MKSAIAPVVFLIVICNQAGATSASKKPRSVSACLATSKEPNSDRCIGVVADPCIGPDEGTKSSADIVACLNGEQREWEAVLNASFQALKNGLESEQRTRLRDMQRSWIDTRDRTCAFYYDYFEGSMANPMIANCLNRETARRAVFLKGFADDLSQRK